MTRWADGIACQRELNMQQYIAVMSAYQQQFEKEKGVPSWQLASEQLGWLFVLLTTKLGELLYCFRS